MRSLRRGFRRCNGVIREYHIFRTRGWNYCSLCVRCLCFLGNVVGELGLFDCWQCVGLIIFSKLITVLKWLLYFFFNFVVSLNVVFLCFFTGDYFFQLGSVFCLDCLFFIGFVFLVVFFSCGV